MNNFFKKTGFLIFPALLALYFLSYDIPNTIEEIFHKKPVPEYVFADFFTVIFILCEIIFILGILHIDYIRNFIFKSWIHNAIACVLCLGILYITQIWGIWYLDMNNIPIKLRP
jgi:hypothetical protein